MTSHTTPQEKHEEVVAALGELSHLSELSNLSELSSMEIHLSSLSDLSHLGELSHLEEVANNLSEINTTLQGIADTLPIPAGHVKPAKVVFNDGNRELTLFHFIQERVWQAAEKEAIRVRDMVVQSFLTNETSCEVASQPIFTNHQAHQAYVKFILERLHTWHMKSSYRPNCTSGVMSFFVSIDTSMAVGHRMEKNGVCHRRFSEEVPCACGKCVWGKCEWEEPKRKLRTHENNSIEAFLMSHQLKCGSEATTYMPRSIFLHLYAEFCKKNQLRAEKLSMMACRSIFAMFKVRQDLNLGSNTMYNGHLYAAGVPFINGIDLRERVGRSADLMDANESKERFIPRATHAAAAAASSSSSASDIDIVAVVDAEMDNAHGEMVKDSPPTVVCQQCRQCKDHTDHREEMMTKRQRRQY